MWSESAFTPSKYGDTQLHFRHQWMEKDFQDHKDWIQQIGKLMEVVAGDSECGTDLPNKDECT